MKALFKQVATLALPIAPSVPLVFSVLFLLSIHAPAETPAPAAKALIVPGEGIGGIKLGADADKLGKQLGAPAFSDAGMGKVVESWYLGTKQSDKGRMFHRPDEIGVRAHFNEDASRHVVSQVEVTSPKYATAEGIAPGNTLDVIRTKFPDIVADDSAPVKFWPLYGEMQFFKAVKRGIAFAVKKSNGVCVQISVMAAGGVEPLLWFYPAATQDYVVDDVNGTVGEIQLGMTDKKLVSLLGKPDEKRDAAPGALWRWKIPQQMGMELPAVCVYLRKLPDGSLIADQIRVSSRAFALTDKIFPGCALKDALQATGNIAKLDSYKDERLDIYGDLRAGLLFDVRQGDSICTAITIFSPPMDVHRNMGTRWLDLPPPVNRDD